jgi:hypothetical protein
MDFIAYLKNSVKRKMYLIVLFGIRLWFLKHLKFSDIDPELWWV